jgi:hypothetical protein
MSLSHIVITELTEFGGTGAIVDNDDNGDDLYTRCLKLLLVGGRFIFFRSKNDISNLEFSILLFILLFD